MIEKLFEQLDDWRHLPSYKLEPRVDALLAVYLRDVVAAHVGAELSETVIPEFPLRKGTLSHKRLRRPNESFKVDFGLFSPLAEVVYLVEVKTDQGSRRKGQDNYLRRARKEGWKNIVDGVVLIAQETDEIPKYVHLLDKLERLRVVQVPPELWAFALPRPKRGVSKLLERVKGTANDQARIEVLYLQPLSDGSANCIGFEEYASVIEQREDGLAPLLARYLRLWQTAAGQRAGRT